MQLGKIVVSRSAQRLVVSYGIKQRLLRLGFGLSLSFLAFNGLLGLNQQNTLLFYLLAPVLAVLIVVGFLGIFSAMSAEADVYAKDTGQWLRYRGFWFWRKQWDARPLEELQNLCIRQQGVMQEMFVQTQLEEALALRDYQVSAMLALSEFLRLPLQQEPEEELQG